MSKWFKYFLLLALALPCSATTYTSSRGLMFDSATGALITTVTPILPVFVNSYGFTVDSTGALVISMSGGGGTGTVTTSGSPASGNLTKFSGASAVTNADLTGDVTTSGALATTIAAGAVTDAKGSLAVKPAVTVVAAANTALSGLLTIDGVTTAAGSIVLATAQSTGSQNGPWVVASGAWTRPTWYAAGSTTQAFQFITTLVRLGTQYAGTTWRITSSGAVTIDTTSTTWALTAMGAAALGRVNVRSFGALGDGTTTDTTAFNNAIDAACTGWTNSAGRQLYVPAGDYNLAGGITHGCTGLHMIGESQQSTQLRSSTGTYVINVPAHVSDYTLENFTIYVPSGNGVGGWNIDDDYKDIVLKNLYIILPVSSTAYGVSTYPPGGVSALSGFNVSAEHVRVDNGAIGFDIRSAGTSDLFTCIECYADASAIGYNINSWAQTTFITSASDGNSVAGWYFNNAQSTTLIGPTSEGSSAGKPFDVVGAGPVTIINPYVEGASVPIYINNASANVVITNPQIKTTVGTASIDIAAAASVTLNGGTSNLDKGLSAAASTFLNTRIGTNIMTNSTGSTLVAPALGTPASGVATNLTGLPEAGVTSLVSDLALKAPLASPTFTGTVGAAALTQTGIYTNSTAGALSAASVNITGAPITGGTATTTFPLVYINSGAAPSSWATTGTGLGLNLPSGFAGNIADFHVNGGSSLWLVSSGGATNQAGGLTIGASSAMTFSGRSKFLSSADGIVTPTNNAGTGLTRLNLGLATSSGPAFCVSGTTITTCLGDGTAGGTFSVPTLTATTFNKYTLTTPASGATLTILDGKTLTANNSLTLAGTDSTTMTFPSVSATITQTVFSGTKALATSAIGSGACTSAQTVAATGTLTTDVVNVGFNGDPTGVTGFVPLSTGMLTLIAYPTADTVNIKECNNTSSSITPGAMTLNVRVAR